MAEERRPTATWTGAVPSASGRGPAPDTLQHGPPLPSADAAPASQSARAPAHGMHVTPSSESTWVTASSGSTDSATGQSYAAGYGDPSASHSVALRPGTQVGPYVLLERIGAGGMGVVHAAHDPRLDRKIAIKVVRMERTRDPEAARARLHREAQALARLSHPNVVSVLDVGDFQGSMFLAMEFIDGVTLRRWLEQSPRDWPEIRRVFVQAGLGLAAAHGAGMVHRDFKPDNVMVGRDGRVRVMDFGLVRDADGPVHVPAPTSNAPVSDGLTLSNAVLGTPLYMAPEQHCGGVTDARTDQFAFCVALWQAVFGAHPFGTSDLITLIDAVSQGRIQPPRRVTVPAQVHAALLRGLSVDRTTRFRDMERLLAQLGSDEEDARHARRRRLSLAALVAGATIGGAALTVWIVQPWAAAPLEATQAAGSVPDAGPQGPRAGAEGTAGAGAPSDAATAGAQGSDASPALALDDSVITGLESMLERGGARAALDRIAQLEGEAKIPATGMSRSRVEYVRGQAHHHLGDAEAAAAAYALALSFSPEDARTHRVDVMTQQAYVLGAELTRTDEALSIVARADEIVALLDDAPRFAALRNTEGSVLRIIGRGAQSKAAFDAGLAALERVNLAESANAATMLSNRGLALETLGKFAEARDDYRRALALHERLTGPDSLSVAATSMNLGNALQKLHALDDAQVALERAVRIRTAALGPEHPETAAARHDLSNVYFARGWLDRARTELEAARRIWIATLGASHPFIASCSLNLGNVYLDLGELQLAREHFNEAIDIWTRVFGERHVAIASAFNGLGNVEMTEGRHALAVTAYEQAIVIESALGDTPGLAFPLTGRGEALVELARHADAIPDLERALAIRSSADGDPRQKAKTQAALARALDGAGRERAVALDLARSALANFEAGGAGATTNADAMRTFIRARGG